MAKEGMFNFGIVFIEPAWGGWNVAFRDGARVQVVRAADLFRRTDIGAQQPLFDDCAESSEEQRDGFDFEGDDEESGEWS